MNIFEHQNRALLSELQTLTETYCREETGFAQAAPIDVISTLAALTGEAIQHELGFFQVGYDERGPSGIFSGPEIEESLMAGQPSLGAVPYDSCALGPLRGLLEDRGYPLDSAPDLVAYARDFGEMCLSPAGYIPMTEEADDHPDCSPRAANAALREKVSALAQTVEGETLGQARYMLCMTALTDAMHRYKEVFPPEKALKTACCTLIAMSMAAPQGVRAPSTAPRPRIESYLLN